MSWDTKGNLVTDPVNSKNYLYTSENQLRVATGGGVPGVTLAYDPAMRLYEDKFTTSGAATRFAYDGVDVLAEYTEANALQRRYVFDPTTGQPVLQYEGTGTGSPRYFSSDERGSIVSATDGSGVLLHTYTYDEYGKRGSGNDTVFERFQYTGQKWIGEIGGYDYKARDYLQHLGIFVQTDPIRYADSPNLYAYVLNDPVNLVDPNGTSITISCTSYPAGFTIVGNGTPVKTGASGQVCTTIVTPDFSTPPSTSDGPQNHGGGPVNSQQSQPKPRRYGCLLAVGEGALNTALDPISLVTTGTAAAVTSAAAIRRAAYPLSRALTLARGALPGFAIATAVAAGLGGVKAYFTDPRCR